MSTPPNYSKDPAAEMIGVEIQEVKAGYAKAVLQIQANHLNGLGMAHGGIVFLLADTVFAHACNARGIETVAHTCQITFYKPSLPGDILTAVADEKYLEGRSGIYDIVITNQNAQVIAQFRGNSMALKK